MIAKIVLTPLRTGDEKLTEQEVLQMVKKALVPPNMYKVLFDTTILWFVDKVASS